VTETNFNWQFFATENGGLSEQITQYLDDKTLAIFGKANTSTHLVAFKSLFRRQSKAAKKYQIDIIKKMLTNEYRDLPFMNWRARYAQPLIGLNTLSDPDWLIHTSAYVLILKKHFGLSKEEEAKALCIASITILFSMYGKNFMLRYFGHHAAIRLKDDHQQTRLIENVSSKTDRCGYYRSIDENTFNQLPFYSGEISDHQWRECVKHLISRLYYNLDNRNLQSSLDFFIANRNDHSLLTLFTDNIPDYIRDENFREIKNAYYPLIIKIQNKPLADYLDTLFKKLESGAISFEGKYLFLLWAFADRMSDQQRVECITRFLSLPPRPCSPYYLPYNNTWFLRAWITPTSTSVLSEFIQTLIEKRKSSSILYYFIAKMSQTQALQCLDKLIPKIENDPKLEERIAWHEKFMVALIKSLPALALNSHIEFIIYRLENPKLHFTASGFLPLIGQYLLSNLMPAHDIETRKATCSLARLFVSKMTKDQVDRCCLALIQQFSDNQSSIHFRAATTLRYFSENIPTEWLVYCIKIILSLLKKINDYDNPAKSLEQTLSLLIKHCDNDSLKSTIISWIEEIELVKNNDHLLHIRCNVLNHFISKMNEPELLRCIDAIAFNIITERPGGPLRQEEHYHFFWKKIVQLIAITPRSVGLLAIIDKLIAIQENRVTQYHIAIIPKMGATQLHSYIDTYLIRIQDNNLHWIYPHTGVIHHFILALREIPRNKIIDLLSQPLIIVNILNYENIAVFPELLSHLSPFMTSTQCKLCIQIIIMIFRFNADPHNRTRNLSARILLAFQDKMTEIEIARSIDAVISYQKKLTTWVYNHIYEVLIELASKMTETQFDQCYSHFITHHLFIICDTNLVLAIFACFFPKLTDLQLHSTIDMFLTSQKNSSAEMQNKIAEYFILLAHYSSQERREVILKRLVDGRKLGDDIYQENVTTEILTRVRAFKVK
jgi:hypothetical protein